jgi:hypothetical protein
MPFDWFSSEDNSGGGGNWWDFGGSNDQPTYDYPTYEQDYPTYDYPTYEQDYPTYDQPTYDQPTYGYPTYEEDYPTYNPYPGDNGGYYPPVDDNGYPMPGPGQYGPTPGGGNIDDGHGGMPPVGAGGRSSAPQQNRGYYGQPGEQAGPPNPYRGGQSPNYNYPGGMNNPYPGQQQGGQQQGGGLLGGLFGGGNNQGGGGGGLFGGSTGSDLLTLLGVGGAMAFLPKLLNSASGGSSGTTVQAPDYSAQWRNLPALPNYSPNLAQAGTNPGMAMSSNPFGAATTTPTPAPALQAGGPVAPDMPTSIRGSLFPGAQ